MAIQFCGPCGNTLDISSASIVRCDCCGSMNKNNLFDGIVTVSSTNNFPSELRRKRQPTQHLQCLAAEDTWATAEETCRKCGAKEVRYTALQLRSADEGTTLFYYCPGCLERILDGTKVTEQQSQEYVIQYLQRLKTTPWRLV
ncbi:DNA-directed RNA polymerase I subunit RPA12 [Trichoderma lentiforme]|uniref:DNA-directed RNA polymerase I subunit RPA12 n=1 Tax=Trichoderma lentiforme TaxID=1567552 RepID=A0A9P5C6Q6_9HYPO|nr:DNA-directed RNA polymerase I subunit RPA12 [Trichoderma lentiforme]